MESGNASVSEWLKFFKDAGIPSGLGANYSVIFCDHRINKDILGDLTREILTEMGIKAMGDIIAILKQAKVIAEQVTRENTSKLLEEKTTKASTTPSKTSSTPAARMITHAINSRDFSKPSTPEQKPISVSEVLPETSVFSRLGKDPPVSESSGVFKRLGDPVVSSTNSELPYAGILKKKGSTQSEAVAQEKNGPPTSGTLTKKIAATKRVALKKKSVLDRLGPATESPKKASPKIKRTISAKSSKAMLQRMGKKARSDSDEDNSSEEEARPKPKIIRVASTLRYARQQANTAKPVVIKKTVSTTAAKKPSNVLTRLGGRTNKTVVQSKRLTPSKKPLAMDSEPAPIPLKKRVLVRPGSANPKHVKLRLRVPNRIKSSTAKPISSDHVSSTTSAGIFKGRSSASSVFDRLGKK